MPVCLPGSLFILLRFIFSPGGDLNRSIATRMGPHSMQGERQPLAQAVRLPGHLMLSAAATRRLHPH